MWARKREELVEQLGSSTVERLARAARLVALSPLRWLPGLGSWAAPDALGAAAAEHVSRSVHVLAAGRIVASGGPELALQLEAEGYDKYLPAAA